MWLEAIYHIPISLWATRALWRGNLNQPVLATEAHDHLDDPVVPLQLLIFAVEVAVSTGACLAEVISWPNVSKDEKLQLGTLYGPYLALGGLKD
jgi:hypothetical protein